MTTATSLQNNRPRWEGMPLFRRLLRRNLPRMGLFFALTFLVLPLQYILVIFDRTQRAPYLAPNGGPARIFTQLSQEQFYCLVTVAAILIALAQTRWLRSKRGSEFWHSLPVKRETLLLANAGAAWFTIALPLVVNYLITIMAGCLRLVMNREEEDRFILPVGEVFLDLLGWLAMSLAIVAILFLVSVLTGRLFETLFSGAVLFLGPSAAIACVDAAIQRYLVGWFGVGWYIEDVIRYVSPLFAMPMRYFTYSTFTGTYATASNLLIPAWLVIGLLCLWLACRLFRSRPTEMAGQGGVREPLGAIGSVIAVFIGGLGVGIKLWDTHFYVPEIPLVPRVLVLSLLGAAALQLILNRGLRGMKKRLSILALCVALPVLFAVVLTTGGLGFESYVPDPASTEWVKVRYRGRYGELATRLDHEWENVEVTAVDLGSPVPPTEGDAHYTYGEIQQVTLTTPEGIKAAEDLHRTLLKVQESYGEGQQNLAGHIDFIYSDGTSRVYGQRYNNNQLFGAVREVEPLLALEENPEFRQQTDPRFTITADEVQAIRVSDVTGLVISDPVTDRESIEKLLAAMKADAEAQDYTAFREGTARAAAYITVETIAPERGEWLTEPLTRDAWRDFSLPVYREDQNTRNALRAVGLEKYTEPSLGRDRITEVLVSWWGDSAWIDEVYWTGKGPQGLLYGSGLASDERDGRLSVTDQGQITRLLDRSLGADCHISEDGFTVTLLGEDHLGCSFWLSWEDAPDEVRSWYEDNRDMLRGAHGMRYQRLPER